MNEAEDAHRDAEVVARLISGEERTTESFRIESGPVNNVPEHGQRLILKNRQMLIMLINNANFWRNFCCLAYQTRL